MGYSRKYVKGKGEIYTFREISVRNLNKWYFSLQYSKWKLWDGIHFFHLRNFIYSKKRLHRDCWLSISAANIGNVAAWCAHCWTVLRLLSSCASVRLVSAPRAHHLVSSHHVACNLAHLRSDVIRFRSDQWSDDVISLPAVLGLTNSEERWSQLQNNITEWRRMSSRRYMFASLIFLIRSLRLLLIVISREGWKGLRKIWYLWVTAAWHGFSGLAGDQPLNFEQIRTNFGGSRLTHRRRGSERNVPAFIL